MRLARLATGCMWSCIAGCASFDEPFAARYRIADPKDRTVIEVAAAGIGRWEMRYGDGPYGDGPLVAATRKELDQWFGEGLDLDAVRCLITQGRRVHPVICAVPKDVPIRFERGAARVPAASKTGWILVAPTAAGLAFGDLVREP